ncbi:MAG: hypothetical protein R6V04_07165 [bacterium]
MEQQKILKAAAVLFLSVLLIVLGCAGGKKLAKPYTGEPETGLTLRYSLQPEKTYQYTSENDMTQNMEMQGRSMQNKSSSILKFTVKGKKLDENNNLVFEVIMDSINSVMEGMGGSRELDLSPFMGKSFEVVLSPYGEELQYIGTDSLQVDVGQMAGGKIGVKRFFQRVFPDIPEKTIKVGETWTENDIDTTNQGGMDVVSNTELKHTFKGIETINGYECVVITSEGDGTLDGKGEQMGNSFVMEGYIEIESTSYFAYKKGIFIKTESNSFIEGTVAITGAMSMTLPMTIETKGGVYLD